MKLHGTMSFVKDELYIGGVSCTELAEIYQTPLYIVDEAKIRENCQSYVKYFAVREQKNRIAYAGKAFLPKYMCRLIAEEGLYLDVVSGGELYTAYQAGFNMEHIIFHGNNKSVDEIELGLTLGIGIFVVDHVQELLLLQKLCKKKNDKQAIYLRIKPGIEAHTHEYIQTGQNDSKFGFSLSGGDFEQIMEMLNSCDCLQLVGLHAHIGSQIFEISPYLTEVKIMLSLAKRIHEQYGIEIQEIDLGGGFGVYYTEVDTPKSIEQFCTAILKEAEEVCQQLKMKQPILILEPGRSIVANAGSTLYTIGATKVIPGIRKYISVDGGMTDNIRPALYQSKYECCFIHTKKQVVYPLNQPIQTTIVGKCCESGDILISDSGLSAAQYGDLCLVSSTGAYGYSMASNYNKIPKAAVVAIKDGKSELICRRQTYADLLELEI